MAGAGLLIERESEKCLSGGDDHMLFAVTQVGDGIGGDLPAGLKIPQGFAGGGIEREKVAFLAAAKDQATGRREHASPGRRMQSEFPPQMAGFRLECSDRAIATGNPAITPGRKQTTRLIFHFTLEEDVASFPDGYI